jgi:cold-inducible RNA-binding protein
MPAGVFRRVRIDFSELFAVLTPHLFTETSALSPANQRQIMKRIYVGNLNLNTSEDALRQLFAAFGPVDQVSIMIDRDTGRSRGFAFVDMANAEDGNKAIAALNGTLLDERALNVNEARAKKEPGNFRDRGYDTRHGGRRW